MSGFLPEVLSSLVRKNPTPNFLNLTDLGALREGFDYSDMRKRLRIGHQQADLKWKKYYYELRVVWAVLTIVLLAVSLAFTFWLVKGVGTGALDFTNYETFLNIIAGEIIINILGLVAIVMHFLFPSREGKK